MASKRARLFPRLNFSGDPSRRYFATHFRTLDKDFRALTPPYPALLEKLANLKKEYLGSRPLSLAEKILYSHLDDPSKSLSGLGPDGKGRVRGERYLQLKPARVAMQDASAQ
jgi:homoaconitase